MKKKFRVIVAPDSFKECMSASRIARVMARGVKRGFPGSAIEEIPLADGGEGLVEVIRQARGGTLHQVTVQDPLGRPVRARYAMLGSGDEAVVEMAAASGLHLLKGRERNPLRTSTFGTGQLMLAAARRGAKRIVVGLGGSGTVDGGAGMAQALGVRLLDGRGRDLPRGGGALTRLRSIDVSGRDPILDGVKIQAACDVTNPLCGRIGAARIYGPQKGATPAAVRTLDCNLRKLARLIERTTGKWVAERPGAGAAGGLGAGLTAFAGARLRSGVDLVLETVDFDRRIRGASIIITGEGRVDYQSAYGKVVSGVAAAGKKRGVPVVVLAGLLGEGYEQVYRCGVTAVFGLSPAGVDPTVVMAETPALLADLAEAVLRLRRVSG